MYTNRDAPYDVEDTEFSEQEMDSRSRVEGVAVTLI